MQLSRDNVVVPPGEQHPIHNLHVSYFFQHFILPEKFVVLVNQYLKFKNIVILNVDLFKKISATSFERSRREPPINMAEHRYILKNNQNTYYPRLSFTAHRHVFWGQENVFLIEETFFFRRKNLLPRSKEKILVARKKILATRDILSTFHEKNS